MSNLTKLEKLALELTEQERATLANRLLNSLPAVLSDQDEGLTEALHRDAEIQADNTQAISLADLDQAVRNRRR
jgi:hypothetical protein